MSDRIARFLAGLTVAAIAIIAGIVSFSHIQAVALSHGYTAGTARLLPFSVDGLILASALVLMVEARAHRPAPAIARAGLWLGIVATLAANVEHGAAYGPVGALANGWPALAFVIASEILLGMLRRAGSTPALDDPVEAVSGTTVDAPVAVPVIAPVNGVPTALAPRTRTVSPGTARKRASAGKARSPETIFGAELDRGTLPSLRAVMRAVGVGQPRAKEILADLRAILDAQPEAMSEAA